MSLYIKAKEAGVQKKYPNLNQKDIREKLTQQWKCLSVLDMAPYRKKHIEMNVKYEEDLVKFYTDHPEAEKLLMRCVCVLCCVCVVWESNVAKMTCYLELRGVV